MNPSNKSSSNDIKMAVIVHILLKTNPKNCSPEIRKIISPLRQKLLLSGLNLTTDQPQLELTYSEKKLLREYVEKNIIMHCKPVVDQFENFTNKSSSDLSSLQVADNEELLRLEAERNQLTVKLADLKNQKCRLLKACADIRVGPQQKNAVEMLNVEMRYNHLKTKILQDGLKNEAISGSQYSQKAIKEVEAHVDIILNN